MGVSVVTGGAGFIGSHLTRTLVRAGHQVRVLDDLSSGAESNLQDVRELVDLRIGDIRDPAALASVCQDADVVFHEAALASVPRSVEAPEDTHSVCTTGTLEVLRAARDAGVRRVVFASSSAVYGELPPAIKPETSAFDPRSPYAAAKLAGEAYCQSFSATYDLETVCLRYFNVFGPGQDPNSQYSAVIPKFVVAMLAGVRPTVFGDGGQSRDFVYVEDVVRANIAAAEAPDASGGVYNVATGDQYTLLELLDRLNELLGTSIEPVFADPRPGDVRESGAIVTRAAAELGFQAEIDFAEGLRRSIDYYAALARQA